MADLGEEAFSSQMKVVATFLRLLEELMRNKQQDLRYGTKTQRRGILGRMKDFVGGIFKKVYDGTFGRLSRNGKDYGQLDLNDPAVAKLFADTMKQMGMQSLFAYPTVLNYFSRFSNEGRKFGLLLTGISQNAVAMLKNKAAQNLVLNSDFLLLLKQSPLDRAEWVRLLGLSEQEEEFIDESVEPGDGLLIAGGARVPIRGKFPSGNVLYDLFSTNPNEAADKKRMQEFAAREKSRLE